MSKVDEVIFDIFGNIQLTTAGIYYDTLYKLIDYIEKISCSHYIIFCDVKITEPIKKIASYYNINYRISNMLPKNTLAIIVNKDNIYPDISITGYE